MSQSPLSVLYQASAKPQDHGTLAADADISASIIYHQIDPGTADRTLTVSGDGVVRIYNSGNLFSLIIGTVIIGPGMAEWLRVDAGAVTLC